MQLPLPQRAHTARPIITSMNVGVHLLCVCPAISAALCDNNKMKTALSASSHSYKPNKAASSLCDDHYAFGRFPLIRIAIVLPMRMCVSPSVCV